MSVRSRGFTLSVTETDIGAVSFGFKLGTASENGSSQVLISGATAASGDAPPAATPDRASCCNWLAAPASTVVASFNAARAPASSSCFGDGASVLFCFWRAFRLIALVIGVSRVEISVGHILPSQQRPAPRQTWDSLICVHPGRASTEVTLAGRAF